MQNSRRNFFKTIGSIAAVSLAKDSFGMPAYIPGLYAPGSKIRGVQMGAITYSFREMADQSAEATLEYLRECGISAIELMGDPAEIFAGAPKNIISAGSMSAIFRKRQAGGELSSDEQKQLSEFTKAREAYGLEKSEWRKTADMKKFEKLRQLYKKGGVEIYAFKPDAFEIKNSDADINFGMMAGKALGAKSVTLEHPSNDAHTLKLGKMAEKIGIKVGYHGHTQETFTFWDTALSQSPANSMNLDFGHFVAAGNPDPLNIIRTKHQHITSMHLKDRKSKENGGANLVWGSGDTPIKEALHLIRDEKYKFPVTIEFEYKIPEGSNSVKEVKKCLEYSRNILES